jgi:hypothetical protein
MFRKILNILGNNESRSVQQIAFAEVKHEGSIVYIIVHYKMLSGSLKKNNLSQRQKF